MNWLRIPIAGLEAGRTPVKLTGDLESLKLEEWLAPKSRLEVEGSIDKFGDTLTVRANARAAVEETCGRCTRIFERPLDVEVMVYCDRQGSDDEQTSRELERDGYLVYHDGVTVDIGEAVREAIILSLPISPVCREDCRGLCPHCGADLNTETCHCTEERSDPRWAVLKRLKGDG